MNPGIKRQTSFDVEVKEDVSDGTITAAVSYDTSEYGSFTSRKDVLVSADVSESGSGISGPSFDSPVDLPDLPISTPMLLIVSTIVLILIIGSIIAVRR